jgi:hypothetical protein
MNLDRGDALDDKHQQDKPLSNKQQKDRGLHDEAHDNTREQGNRPHEDTPTLPPPPTSSLTITSSLVLPFCLILPSSLTLPLSLAAAVSVDIEDRNPVWRGYLSAPPRTLHRVGPRAIIRDMPCRAALVLGHGGGTCASTSSSVRSGLG